MLLESVPLGVTTSMVPLVAPDGTFALMYVSETTWNAAVRPVKGNAGRTFQIVSQDAHAVTGCAEVRVGLHERLQSDGETEEDAASLLEVALPRGAADGCSSVESPIGGLHQTCSHSTVGAVCLGAEVVQDRVLARRRNSEEDTAPAVRVTNGVRHPAEGACSIEVAIAALNEGTR